MFLFCLAVKMNDAIECKKKLKKLNSSDVYKCEYNICCIEYVKMYVIE